jgi:hypothetical protein
MMDISIQDLTFAGTIPEGRGIDKMNDLNANKEQATQADKW